MQMEIPQPALSDSGRLAKIMKLYLMENKDLDFLIEIGNALSDLRKKIGELENMVEEYLGNADSEVVESEPIDLDIEESDEDTFTAAETQDEDSQQDGDDWQDEHDRQEEDDDTPQEKQLQEEQPMATDEPEILLMPDTDEPPAVSKPGLQAKAHDAVIDAMAQKQPWRTDMPGSTVKDIRSAISLNDRILFINTLFDEDPMKFQDTVAAINAMTSFGQVIDLVNDKFGNWNLDSEIVYRFMMAVRRRFN